MFDGLDREQVLMANQVATGQTSNLASAVAMAAELQTRRTSFQFKQTLHAFLFL